MIDKLSKNPINSFVSSVYEFNELTLQELLSKFFNKINECVDNSNQSLEFLTWLKEEGLPIEVQKEIEKMYLDGRLTEIVNQLANDVKGQVAEVKEDLQLHKADYTEFKNNTNSDLTNLKNNKLDKTEYEQFKTSTEESLLNHSSKLEHIETKLKGNFINILEYQSLVVDNDWSIAIQKAIDDTNTLDNMCEIIFPIGTYEFNTTIVLKNNTKLIGRSKEYTILKYTGNNTAMLHEHSETNGSAKNTYINNLKLYDFTLLGTGIEGSRGLWIVHGGNHKYSNLRVDNFDTNIILGSKEEQYSLLFSELQFDSYNAKNISLLIRHIEDCIFPRNLIGGGATKCEKAIQIGDVTNNGASAKPYDIQFNMCVFQGAKVGVYHDGGYSVNFYGGHCEGLDKMVVQTSRTDRGLNFTGMTKSQTVLSIGDLSVNGINLETNGLSPKTYSSMLFYSYDGVTIPCRTNPYDVYKIQTKIDFTKWQIGAFRVIINLESSVTTNKLLRLLTLQGYEVARIETTATGMTTVVGNWTPFIPNNTMPSTELTFYLQTIGTGQDSGTIKLYSVELQGTQFI